MEGIHDDPRFAPRANRHGDRPSSTSASSEETLWTVPDGVTQIHVEVVGAGGGGSGSSGGGSGALITGQLAVTPGQSVRMLVGAGGSRQPSSDERVAGGQGHGDGGSSPAFTGSILELARGRGGTGGGGSSLSVDGTVLVVTDGGGGGGGRRVSAEFAAVGARGGDAAAAGGNNTAKVIQTGTEVLARGGQPGSNSGPGLGGAQGSVALADGTDSETTQIRRSPTPTSPAPAAVVSEAGAAADAPR